MRRLNLFFLGALLLCSVSCIKDNRPGSGGVDLPSGETLYVVNEGSFGYGNASLTAYNLTSGEVMANVFYNANGFLLGDVAQSMTVHGESGWIVVNNSKVIFEVGMGDLKEKGRVTGFTSPRHIVFASDAKAYVSEIYSGEIKVVNPRTYEITGSVDVGTNAEEMLISDGYLYAALWNSGKEIVKIDTATDEVAARLEVGIQPCSMELDAEGKLWVLCDGSASWTGNPAGSEDPSLLRIDLETFTVEKTYTFKDYVSVNYSSVSNLEVSDDGKMLYWLDGKGVMNMSITSDSLPAEPLVEAGEGRTFYSMLVDGGRIFVGDAVDYSQNGKVYIYTTDGKSVADFTAGICPGDFCLY